MLQDLLLNQVLWHTTSSSTTSSTFYKPSPPPSRNGSTFFQPSTPPSRNGSTFFQPSTPPSRTNSTSIQPTPPLSRTNSQSLAQGDSPKGKSRDNNDSLPPVNLLFITFYNPDTDKISIACPNESYAKTIKERFGNAIGTRLYDSVNITCQEWADNKDRFNNGLPEEFQELSQFIEKTYCKAKDIEYKPPLQKTSLLQDAKNSLNDEPDADDEESSKCRFCCC